MTAVLLEAHAPPAERDAVRLLVTQGSAIRHSHFRSLPDFLQKGDLLVVNDSATLPASFHAGPVLLNYSGRLPDGRWVVEPRLPKGHGSIPAIGFPGAPGLQPYSKRLWTLETDADPISYLSQHGQPIRYPYAAEAWPLEAYQSYFARVPGSSEMPSAGRPFSDRVMADLQSKGVRVAPLTLHTGVSSLESGEGPYPEWFSVPEATREAIRHARRVIAVGTTVLRALESPTQEGWTNHVVTPENFQRSADGLITGLHEATSTHLWMLRSLMDARHLDRAYAQAVERGYLWHEFGDSHLLLSGSRREYHQVLGVS